MWRVADTSWRGFGVVAEVDRMTGEAAFAGALPVRSPSAVEGLRLRPLEPLRTACRWVE